MKIKNKRLSTVTPFSRTFTAILFLTVPLIMFFIGINYGRDLERVDSTLQEAQRMEDALANSPARVNAITYTSQKPGRTATVERVVVSEPGYVVVYRVGPDGSMGRVIGTSERIASMASDLAIPLSEQVKKGDEVAATIHLDSGSGVGEPVKTNGKPVTQSVIVAD